MLHSDPTKRSYKIAVIPGDGIGREVVPEGVRVLEAAAKHYGFKLQLDEFHFASCDYYQKHNKMLPDDWKDQIGHHIDILTAHFVLNPDRFDVVVASNLFGDILSDLGPACAGTIGIAPSGNINPERRFPSLFEPVHGSAPDIAGKGIANPIGQIWSAAMMLDHLGEVEAGAAILKAIETTLVDKSLCTRDVGGTANTSTAGKAITNALASVHVLA